MNTSDSSDTPLDSIKSAFIQRLNTPVFGFIFFAWVIGNWDAILYIAFSKYPIEYRISHTDFHYMYPVISGFLLSIIYPYIQLGLEWLHNKSDSMRHTNEAKRKTFKMKSDELVRQTELDIKAKSDLERSKRENIAIEERTRHQVEIQRINDESEFNTNKLKGLFEEKTKDIDDLTIEINELIKLKKDIESDFKELYLFIGDLKFTINGINNIVKEFSEQDNSLSKSIKLASLTKLVNEPYFEQLLNYLIKVEQLEKKFGLAYERAFFKPSDLINE